MSDPLPAIGYAPPTNKPHPHAALFYLAILGWMIAALGGVICLTGFAATERDGFVNAGFAWIGIGGLITLVSLVSGVVYQRRASASSYPSRHTATRATLAVLLPASNVLLALVMAAGGFILLERARERITIVLGNPSALAIDDVSVVFGDGSHWSLGTIAPRGKRSATFVAVDGKVSLDVHSNGHAWRQTVVDGDADSLLDGPWEVTLVDPSSNPAPPIAPVSSASSR